MICFFNTVERLLLYILFFACYPAMCSSLGTQLCRYGMCNQCIKHYGNYIFLGIFRLIVVSGIRAGSKGGVDKPATMLVRVATRAGC